MQPRPTLREHRRPADESFRDGMKGQESMGASVPGLKKAWNYETMTRSGTLASSVCRRGWLN